MFLPSLYDSRLAVGRNRGTLPVFPGPASATNAEAASPRRALTVRRDDRPLLVGDNFSLNITFDKTAVKTLGAAGVAESGRWRHEPEQAVSARERLRDRAGVTVEAPHHLSAGAHPASRAPNLGGGTGEGGQLRTSVSNERPMSACTWSRPARKTGLTCAVPVNHSPNATARVAMKSSR